MSDSNTDPDVTDLVSLLGEFQSLLGTAAQAAVDPQSPLAGNVGLQKRLQGTVANLHLVGTFNLLEGTYGERCWENSGCHEEEFRLLWALRAAIVHGNGHLRRLRGNHQRKTINEGLKKLKAGVFGVAPYFQLVDGEVVRLEGANLRLTTLVKALLMQEDTPALP